MDHCPRCGTQDSGQGRHECPIELTALTHVEPLVIECPPRKWHGPEPRSTLTWIRRGDSWRSTVGDLHCEAYRAGEWKWRVSRLRDTSRLDGIVARYEVPAPGCLERALWECEVAAKEVANG